MKLFYRKFGEGGYPFIILHGLFGQSDNWNTLAKQISERGFEVYTVDQRNHGLSPHSTEWNYQTMSDDIVELIKDLHLKKVILMGHSMGGKTAMQVTINHSELIDKLIVVDIAPRYYPPHHQSVLQGLSAVDFNVVKTRKEADLIMSEHITDMGTKQFLLKNIFWKDTGEMDWRFNFNVIREQIENTGEMISASQACNVPALFIKGEKSDYIDENDVEMIRKIFPQYDMQTIIDAGHWIHAEKPVAFLEVIFNFLKSHPPGNENL